MAEVEGPLLVGAAVAECWMVVVEAAVLWLAAVVAVVA